MSAPAKTNEIDPLLHPVQRRKDPPSISLLVLSQTSTGKVSTTRVQKRTLVHAHDKV
jgi:hypothetical protein